MPDVHQPDDADRRRAEADGGRDGVTGDWAERVPVETLRQHAGAAGISGTESMSRTELVEVLRRVRPSGRNDPSYPEAPLT
jgi:hypothetical protein